MAAGLDVYEEESEYFFEDLSNRILTDDILARLPERDRHALEGIKRITVSGPQGEPIPLTSVAEVSLASGVGAIMRLDQKRVVTISGDVQGRLANDVIREIDGRLKQDFNWPRGYTYSFTGEQREQEKAQVFLSKAFVATLFIILIILLTQFNSFLTPFIILTSVVLSPVTTLPWASRISITGWVARALPLATPPTGCVDTARVVALPGVTEIDEALTEERPVAVNSST